MVEHTLLFKSITVLSSSLPLCFNFFRHLDILDNNVYPQIKSNLHNMLLPQL